jgi:glycosyltransferase involved in cell wall biosynthesis
MLGGGEPLNVLHLNPGNLFGGIETLLTTLATQQHLCPEMQSGFALCYEGRLATNIRATDSPLHIFSNPIRLSRPWTVWQARQELRQLLQKQQVQVVVSHACWPMVVFGPTVQALGIPLVFWCHDTPTGRHWLERQASRVLPSYAIANSQYIQSQLPQLYPSVPSQVIYAPVADNDPQYTSPKRSLKRAEFNTPSDAIVIIQVSRLELWKGQQLLLSSLALLKDIPNWVCWIVGGAQRSQEAAYLANLRAQICDSGIEERVQFLGQRSDVAELLAAADIHCQPNIFPEPFGITFIEALYANLPVITTAMGGAKKIITSDCGRLVTPGNPQLLAETIRLLIQSPEIRRTLGAHGKRRAQALCTPQQQLQKLYQVLQQQVVVAAG